MAEAIWMAWILNFEVKILNFKLFKFEELQQSVAEVQFLFLEPKFPNNDGQEWLISKSEI